MKTCNKCHLTKPLDDFANQKSRKDGKQGQCKACRKEWYDNYYKNNPKEKQRLVANLKRDKAAARALIREAKDQPCVDCGVKYPYYVMDFDHLGNKDFTIGGALTKSLAALRAEISKCDVVCSNCHRIRTHERLTDEAAA